jgi:6-phosphogluconolactonase
MLTEPRLEVFADPEAAAARGAALVAERLRAAAAERGVATFAVSGGSTPTRMLERLAAESLPWRNIVLFQVDERVAPDGDSSRNATQIRSALGAQVERYPEQFHWMPVTAADLAAGARQYEAAVIRAVGSPPVLDAVHLGLGVDGHTASIFAGDVLDERHDVAVTPAHDGRRRMTLTTSLINRARSILWLVTGADKAPTLARLLSGDADLVASRIARHSAVIIADAAAAALTRRPA